MAAICAWGGSWRIDNPGRALVAMAPSKQREAQGVAWTPAGAEQRASSREARRGLSPGGDRLRKWGSDALGMTIDIARPFGPAKRS
jgi:hypothetical protein